jgi:hypothetical protein
MKASIRALGPDGLITLTVEAENELETSLMVMYRVQTGMSEVTSLWYGEGRVQLMNRALYEARATEAEEKAK